MSLHRSSRAWLPMLSVLLTGALIMPPSLAGAETTAVAVQAEVTSSQPLQQLFEEAAREFGVPLNVLLSVAYNESRWEDHLGQPSASGGYGIMHLTQLDLEVDAKGSGDAAEPAVADDPALHTLDRAAALLGINSDVLKKDVKQNIRGGAALLAEYARETVGSTPQQTADWYGAVAKYSGSNEADLAKGFADQVYATINAGVERTTFSGQVARLTAEAVTPNRSTADPLALRNADKSDADCPNGLACRFIPARYEQYSSSQTNYGNYDIANRPEDGNDIRYIIIHDVEGSYESAIKTFLAKSFVSAHYVIRSSDGEITQMLRPKDVGWHAGNWYINAHSIGIEHSGFAVEGAAWYSEQMYHASARLVKHLAEKYQIPLDRQHILGHDDLPGLTPYNQSRMHWDPGAYWDWEHYFNLLGAPFNPSNGDKDSGIVTIAPKFKQNEPVLTYGGQQLATQPANVVPLYTAPSFDAPLISDPALHPDGKPGTTVINDWGSKATIGQRFAQAGREGDWTAIYYAGQTAWLYDPNGKTTVAGSGMLVTAKAGLTSIPVYGAAFPEPAAYAQAGVPARNLTPLQYQIPAGQTYVATGPIQSDEYYAKLFNAPSTYKVVKGETEYYQISFNHRQAFVKKSDVDVITN